MSANGAPLSSSSHSLAHPRYRADIDGLRAFAVASVVGFHYFPEWFPGGFVGVDIFFVISGFLISSILIASLQHQKFSFLTFYARRIRRIFPALIIVLFACWLLGWFALLPDEFRYLGKHIVAGAGFVTNVVLDAESGYFDKSADSKLLLHLWSLGIEEQFYLIWPLLLWIGWRSRIPLQWVIIGCGLVSFALNIANRHIDPVSNFYLPQSRFWELLAGAALAWRHGSKDATPKPALNANLIAIAGSILLVGAVFGLQKSVTFPGWWALAPVGGAVLLIAAGEHARINRILFSNKAVVWVGLISYPLYLWHWPLLVFARTMESGTVTTAIKMACLLLSLLLATATYWLIERPLRNSSQLGRSSSALLVLMILMSLLGLATYLLNGIPSRITAVNPYEKAFQWQTTIAENAQYSQRCRVMFPDKPNRGACELTQEAAPTMLLLGDSHARTLSVGLRETLEGTGENLMNLGAVGCIPLVGIYSMEKSAGEQERQECRDIMAFAFSVAETTDSLKTIILHGRWPLYISGKGYVSEGGTNENDHDIDLRSPDYAGTDKTAMFEDALLKTLARLQRANKNVVLVLDNPELGFDPAACIENRPLRLTKNVKTPCAVPTSEYLARYRLYEKSFALTKQRFPGVQVLSGADAICDDQWCWAIKDGALMYRDDDHLSLDGSRAWARQLWSQINVRRP